MKQLITFILLTISLNLSFGQKVTWSSEYNNLYSEAISYRYGYLTMDNNALYMIQKKGYTEHFFEKYNWELKDEKITEMTSFPQYKNINKGLDKIFNFNGETYAITNAKDANKKIFYYILEKFNKESLSFVFEKELFAIEYEKTPTGHFNLHFEVSPNGKKLLARYSHSEKNKKTSQYTFTVYDENFIKSWEKTVDLPKTEEFNHFAVHRTLISNNSNIFFLGGIDRTSEKSSAFPKWDFRLISIFEQGDKVEFFSIAQKEDVELDMLEALTTTDNNFVISAFYHDKKSYKKNQILGNYHLKINSESKEKEVDQFYPFNTKNFKVTFNGTLENSSLTNNENYSLSVGYVYCGTKSITENGVLYRTLRHTISGSNTMYGNSFVYYEQKQMYVFKILPNGNIDWIREIPMLGYSETASRYVNDKFCIVTNENINNLNLKSGSSPQQIPIKNKMKDNGCLVVIKFDAEGNSNCTLASTYEKISGGTKEFFYLDKEPNKLLMYVTDEKETKRYIGLIELD